MLVLLLNARGKTGENECREGVVVARMTVLGRQGSDELPKVGIPSLAVLSSHNINPRTASDLNQETTTAGSSIPNNLASVTMSSYLSNILTNTTSKYNTLRRNLLSDEVDGDTEDDSHLCRALRAYYTEQNKAFPPWLPNDPKRSASVQTTSSFTSSLRQQSSQQTPTINAPQGGGRGGLSDLWDTPGQRQASPQPQSLRVRAQERSGSFQGRAQGGDSLAAPRPLPSQRAGSYQSSVAQQQQGSDPSPPASSGGTAQDRLKARLWGAARAGAAVNTMSGQGAGAGGASPAGSGRFARG
jgi:hypothetical protein